MKTIQLTFLFEDTGFCKDVFRSVSQPYYYCNRDMVDGIWYTSTPDYYENDCRIRKDVMIEIISDGQGNHQPQGHQHQRDERRLYDAAEPIFAHSLHAQSYPFPPGKPHSRKVHSLSGILPQSSGFVPLFVCPSAFFSVIIPQNDKRVNACRKKFQVFGQCCRLFGCIPSRNMV